MEKLNLSQNELYEPGRFEGGRVFLNTDENGINQFMIADKVGMLWTFDPSVYDQLKEFFSKEIINEELEKETPQIIEAPGGTVSEGFCLELVKIITDRHDINKLMK